MSTRAPAVEAQRGGSGALRSRAPSPPDGAAPAPDRAPTSAAASVAPGAARLVDAARITGWLSITAGAIHAVAMVDHFDHYWLYGAFFLVVTYGQVLWGVALLRRPASYRMLRAGIAANLAVVAIWLVSRTVGVPIGPEAGGPEPVGAADLAVTIDQLVVCAYAATLARARLREARGFRFLLGPHRIRLAMALGSASLFASLLGGHSH